MRLGALNPRWFQENFMQKHNVDGWSWKEQLEYAAEVAQIGHTCECTNCLERRMQDGIRAEAVRVEPYRNDVREATDDKIRRFLQIAYDAAQRKRRDNA